MKEFIGYKSEDAYRLHYGIGDGAVSISVVDQ